VLRTLHIIVRSRKQLADYALNVVAYVACLRSVLPLRGQYPKPSAPALHHPAALCTQKKDRFIPVNAFALC